MKYYNLFFLILFNTTVSLSQETLPNTQTTYKKKVLESTEVDLLMSYYVQDGTHAAVNGGLGTEELTDITPTIVVSIPIGEDNILTVDAGVSAYTSASSSNTVPFDSLTNASETGSTIGSPWVASSGASYRDEWISGKIAYQHYSDDRNFIWDANASYSFEYDYKSIGAGLGFKKFINEKNTSFNFSLSAFFDNWRPVIYPTELQEFERFGENFQNRRYFSGIPVWNQNAELSSDYLPSSFSSFTETKRETLATSFGFSQILNKNLQVSFFADLIFQQGLLSNPFQRVYFADVGNYYIGNPDSIVNYESETNIDVFHLADDNEQLPSFRMKIPIGLRANYYVNEFLVLRNYYRFYIDDWGILAHTASIEAPIKLALGKFTLLPNYRFYIQEQANYFAPYDQHVSTDEFYTSDYDLSGFTSHQLGFGFRYTDIFTNLKLFKLGLKSIDLRYAHYMRSDGLRSNIVSTAIKFVVD